MSSLPLMSGQEHFIIPQQQLERGFIRVSQKVRAALKPALSVALLISVHLKVKLCET